MQHSDVATAAAFPNISRIHSYVLQAHIRFKESWCTEKRKLQGRLCCDWLNTQSVALSLHLVDFSIIFSPFWGLNVQYDTWKGEVKWRRTLNRKTKTKCSKRGRAPTCLHSLCCGFPSLFVPGFLQMEGRVRLQGLSFQRPSCTCKQGTNTKREHSC